MNDMTKTCQMCFMRISEQAKKCPHCHHFQNKLSMFMFHPIFGAIFIIIPTIIMVLFANRNYFGEDFQNYSDQLQISESRMIFGDDNAGGTVAVMGVIRNNSLIPWKDIRFHVEFQDATGVRSDTGQKEESYYLPANSSLSFKVSFRRHFPETRYVSHTMRLVSAKDGRKPW